jgi:hypothetical protein
MDLAGCEPERLTLEQQIALTGKWIALEIYTPEALPLRRIAAVGESAADCMRKIAEHGADPANFEYDLYHR